MWKYICFLYIFSDDETFGYEIGENALRKEQGLYTTGGNKTDP